MMTGSKTPVLTQILSMQIYTLAHIFAASVALIKLNTHWQMVSISDKKYVHLI